MTAPRRLLRAAWPVVAGLGGLVLVWDLAVRITDPEAYLLPSPADVWTAGWGTREVLDDHLRSTLTVAVVGLLVGTATGVLLAVALALSDTTRRVVQPLLVVSQSVPSVVLAPLFIVWFGFGPGPKVLVVALIAFFPVAIGTLEGLRGADPELCELLRGLGAGRLTVLWRVRLPSALPGAFAGARVAAAYAVFGAVVAEWMGASEGLGVYLQRSQASFRTDQIFAAVGLIAVAGVVLFGVVAGLAALATPWTRVPEEDPR